MSKNMIMVLCVILLTASFVVFGISVFSKLQKFRCYKNEYSSTASLDEINEIDELHMMRYPYKGIAIRVQEVEKKGRKEKKVLYKVAYKGWATIGSEKNMTFERDDSAKRILVHIPDPEIIDYKVEFKSMDYIFEKRRYETETVSADSYKLCLDHMKEKIYCDAALMKRAKKNTSNTVKGYIGTMFPDYEIICD